MSKFTHEGLESDSVLSQHFWNKNKSSRHVSRRNRKLRERKANHSHKEASLKIQSISEFLQAVEKLSGIKMGCVGHKTESRKYEVVLGSENISLPGRAVGTFTASAQNKKEAMKLLWEKVKSYLDFLDRNEMSLALTCRLACRKS